MLHMLPLVAILLASWPLLLVHYIFTDFYIISGIIPDALIPTWTAHPSPWAPRSSGFCPCSLLYLIHSPPWCYPRLVLLNLYRAERSPGFLVRCNFKVSRWTWGLRACISPRLPGDADAACPRTIFWIRKADPVGRPFKIISCVHPLHSTSSLPL